MLLTLTYFEQQWLTGYFTQLSENFAVWGYSMGGEVIIALFKIRADGYTFIPLESHCAKNHIAS